jgi:hypothetical protein
MRRFVSRLDVGWRHQTAGAPIKWQALSFEREGLEVSSGNGAARAPDQLVKVGEHCRAEIGVFRLERHAAERDRARMSSASGDLTIQDRIGTVAT